VKEDEKGKSDSYGRERGEESEREKRWMEDG
jgi:hypothetical protein